MVQAAQPAALLRDKANRPRQDGEVDPDIAHIVPGPQPQADEEEGQ